MELLRKKVIIDLDGVVFEPIAARFATATREKYGPVKAAAMNFAYKYGPGRGTLYESMEETFHECAMNPKIKDGAIAAIERIAKLPGTAVEVCSRLSYPEYASIVEQAYRAIAPCMNDIKEYRLAAPFGSLRGHICKMTEVTNDTKLDMNVRPYVVSARINDLFWPARWRIMPVLIGNGNRLEKDNTVFTGKVFATLGEFAEYLSRQR